VHAAIQTFDESAGLPHQEVGGEDTVPVDFLDGSTVLAPLTADAAIEDVQPEEEYVDQEQDAEATNAVRVVPLQTLLLV
jgi:hypothetical protein